MNKPTTPPPKLGKKAATTTPTPIEKVVKDLKATSAKVEKAIETAPTKDKPVLKAFEKVVDRAIVKAEKQVKAATPPALKISSVDAALAKIKKSANQALAADKAPVKPAVDEAKDEDPAPISYIPAKAKHGEAAHLLPAAMVRKPPVVAKKAPVIAAGKISLADLRDRMKAAQPTGPAPLFDAKAHLKR